MQIIHAVLFEPVGCLAEFPAREFDEIAARLFQQPPSILPAVKRFGGCWICWRRRTLSPAEQKLAEELEVQAVNQIELYEDVLPAFSELQGMGIQLVLASSLSGAAVSRFLERFPRARIFLWRFGIGPAAGGVKACLWPKPSGTASLQPDHVIALMDTMEGLEVARALRTNSMLMINDYEQGRRLALYAPAAGSFR